jgi:hypothetical protein
MSIIEMIKAGEDDKIRELIKIKEKARRDDLSRLRADNRKALQKALQKAAEKVIEKDKIQGNIEVSRNIKKDISKTTQLSIEDIEKL